ncbi:MAG: hypothetical protein ACREWE_07940 [Gammaproteobacteria bacterium]
MRSFMAATTAMLFPPRCPNGNYKDADKHVIQVDGSGSRFERADRGLTHPSNGDRGSHENQHRPNAPGDMRALLSALCSRSKNWGTTKRIR